jgi:hypothetical protein
VTETERKLDLLLGDALAENERLKYEVKRQEIVIAQLLLAMHEGGTLRVRDADLLLGDALAENERLKRELKYQDAREGHIGTHGPECWTFGPRHYECAIRHINSMTDDGK